MTRRVRIGGVQSQKIILVQLAVPELTPQSLCKCTEAQEGHCAIARIFLSYGLDGQSKKDKENNMASLSKDCWSKAQLRLLLVEDNSILQMCLTNKLKALGCDVVLATTGEEAVERFSPEFDGVLMDLNLPGISGYEATKTIRQQYPGVETPIMASTTEDASCLKLCSQIGMDGFLQKPWNEKEVTDFLMALEKKQRIDSASYLKAI